VLPDIPKSRTEFKQALQGQRIVMMDGTSIAIEAAKSLLNTGKEDGLYSRVCDQSQAQAKMRNQAEGGKEQNGAKETKQAGRGRWRQKADSGGGGSKREKKEPHVPCILRVIYAYLGAVPRSKIFSKPLRRDRRAVYRETTAGVSARVTNGLGPQGSTTRAGSPFLIGWLATSFC
jgi:hypothetical protein